MVVYTYNKRLFLSVESNSVKFAVLARGLLILWQILSEVCMKRLLLVLLLLAGTAGFAFADGVALEAMGSVLAEG